MVLVGDVSGKGLKTMLKKSKTAKAGVKKMIENHHRGPRNRASGFVPRRGSSPFN